MKKNLFYLLLALSVSSLFSHCKQRETESPTPSEPSWSKGDIESILNGIFRVEKVYRVTGADTVDLDQDPTITDPLFKDRKTVLFGFHSGNVVVWGADPKQGNPKFREGAETYHFSERAVRLSNMRYKWDEDLETITAQSSGTTFVVNAPSGYTGILDKKSIVNYKSYQEEEDATVPSNLTFRVDAGEDVYLCHLRRVWRYESDLVNLHYAYYVVFP